MAALCARGPAEAGGYATGPAKAAHYDVRPARAGRYERSPAEAGRYELGPAKAGRYDVRPAETGRYEVGPAEAGHYELDSAEAGCSELSAVEPSLYECLSDHRLLLMSDRPSAELDTLLARIATRTAALRKIDVRAMAADDERALLQDLAAVAARLRASANDIGAGLARILDATVATPDTDHQNARRRKAAAARHVIDPLTRIAILRGTDKWGAHFYTPVYHELFEHLRGLPIRLLEIGVGGHDSRLTGGASLRMWADYFPHARIVGIDIAEKQLPRHARITVLRGGQEDGEFLTRVAAEHGPFDIVIDDGSHVPAHVRASFDVLFPLLSDAGFYVVEDVQTAFWPRFGGSPAGGAETMALARMALDALNHAEIVVADPEWVPPSIAPMIRSVRAYHNLLVFQKGDNREPSTGRFEGNSPHVAAALAAMEEVLASAPTAAGLAHLARTYSQAKDRERAVETLQRGLALWPDDIDLLVVAAKVARRCGNDAMANACRERLAALAGDEPAVQQVTVKPDPERSPALRKGAAPKIAG